MASIPLFATGLFSGIAFELNLAEGPARSKLPPQEAQKVCSMVFNGFGSRNLPCAQDVVVNTSGLDRRPNSAELGVGKEDGRYEWVGSALHASKPNGRMKRRPLFRDINQYVHPCFLTSQQQSKFHVCSLFDCTQMFKMAFPRQAAVQALLATTAAVSAGVAACNAPAGSHDRLIYTVVGGTMFALLPYTQLVLMPTNW